MKYSTDYQEYIATRWTRSLPLSEVASRAIITSRDTEGEHVVTLFVFGGRIRGYWTRLGKYNVPTRTRRIGMNMAIMNFLSDIRNAAIANAVIVVFHVYIAFAVEGVSFLAIVLPVGALVAGAYFVKGKFGAALLAIPTLAYLFVVPDLVEGLITLDVDKDIGYFSFLLGPFWLFTILLNIMSIVAEVRGTSKYAKQS
ncbi:MAG: hypothetical protein VX966_09660 [Chloroflexota bacterium]|nr:hypothetical protein [Chloroflexota bacterium]